MPANPNRIARRSAAWEPPVRLRGEVDRLMTRYRVLVQEVLGELTAAHFPALARRDTLEYRKMVELSTKMTVVGHACCEAAGFPYDERRQRLSLLYGGCCFLADSFLDDYGEGVAAEYLDRFELLLSQGWFEVRNARERLFYVVVARLFAERDLLDPMLRQAIYALFLAQKRDVALRMDAPSFRALPRRRKLGMLRQCARDHSGHAILVLTRLLAPRLPLPRQHLLFLAGAMIMFTDDHGDCHADLRAGRLTYMNQVRRPESRLRRLFHATTARLREGLPRNHGQRLLCAFLFRYYQTRLAKHARERRLPGLWQRSVAARLSPIQPGRRDAGRVELRGADDGLLAAGRNTPRGHPLERGGQRRITMSCHYCQYAAAAHPVPRAYPGLLALFGSAVALTSATLWGGARVVKRIVEGSLWHSGGCHGGCPSCHCQGECHHYWVECRPPMYGHGSCGCGGCGGCGCH